MQNQNSKDTDLTLCSSGLTWNNSQCSFVWPVLRNTHSWQLEVPSSSESQSIPFSRVILQSPHTSPCGTLKLLMSTRMGELLLLVSCTPEVWVCLVFSCHADACWILLSRVSFPWAGQCPALTQSLHWGSGLSWTGTHFTRFAVFVPAGAYKSLVTLGMWCCCILFSLCSPVILV